MGNRKKYIRKRIILVLIIVILLLFVTHIFSDALNNRTTFSQTGMGEENIKVSPLIIDHLKDIKETPMLACEDVADLEHFEIALVSDETYEIIKIDIIKLISLRGFKLEIKKTIGFILKNFTFYWKKR